MNSLRWPVWSLPVTQSDVGQTFAMPSDVLDDFAATLGTGNENLLITMNLDSIGPGGPVQSGYLPTYFLTNGTLSNNPQVIRHAPVLGPVFTGYTISSITQTLNSLEIVQQSSTRFLLRANSNFHIYGIQIPPLAGDYNINGGVDAADYVVWRDRVANFDPMPNGSGQRLFEGLAVPQDYEYWRAHYGGSAFPANSQGLAIPEPSTCLLAVICLAMLPSRRRRQFIEGTNN